MIYLLKIIEMENQMGVVKTLSPDDFQDDLECPVCYTIPKATPNVKMDICKECHRKLTLCPCICIIPLRKIRCLHAEMSKLKTSKTLKKMLPNEVEAHAQECSLQIENSRTMENRKMTPKWGFPSKIGFLISMVSIH